MSVLVFDQSEPTFSDHFKSAELVTTIQELNEMNFEKFDIIAINGNQHEPLSLPYYLLTKLWGFVEKGGTLYGEMIHCENFTSSRLFGFKQDFPLSQKRMEKIKVSYETPYISKGSLMDFSNTFLAGFSFESEVLLRIGIYKDTHHSSVEEGYPALIKRKMGDGKTILSTFPLFSCNNKWMLRPNNRWNKIVEFLKSEEQLPIREFTPVIKTRNRTISESIHENIKWFYQSGILPAEDGSMGVNENIHSFTGKITNDFRPDCHVQSALMFYLHSIYDYQNESEQIAHSLMDFIIKQGLQETREQLLTHGFWKWYWFPGDGPDQIFTDDNSWIAFVSLYLYRKTGKDKYRKTGLATINALYRTQNKDGLRPEVLRGKELSSQPSKKASWNPHFESIAHAAFIQAYRVTGDSKYLDIAVKGTKKLLENIDHLQFMYSKTAGYARFLLPLAYLYQLTEDEEIQEGLYKVFNYLSSCQSQEGGVLESENPNPDKYEEEDTGVFRFQNERITDQLYTNNFLLMNSWEAWRATGDKKILDFYHRLASYLCNIQVDSSNKRFHGGWMRAYDLIDKEYFGNNGDTGWGPYCMESGWTQGIISSGLLLSQLNQSLLD